MLEISGHVFKGIYLIVQQMNIELTVLVHVLKFLQFIICFSTMFIFFPYGALKLKRQDRLNFWYMSVFCHVFTIYFYYFSIVYKLYTGYLLYDPPPPQMLFSPLLFVSI